MKKPEGKTHLEGLAEKGK